MEGWLSQNYDKVATSPLIQQISTLRIYKLWDLWENFDLFSLMDKNFDIDLQLMVLAGICLLFHPVTSLDGNEYFVSSTAISGPILARRWQPTFTI